jgi:hypothetical protein
LNSPAEAFATLQWLHPLVVNLLKDNLPRLAAWQSGRQAERVQPAKAVEGERAAPGEACRTPHVRCRRSAVLNRRTAGFRTGARFKKWDSGHFTTIMGTKRSLRQLNARSAN